MSIIYAVLVLVGLIAGYFGIAYVPMQAWDFIHRR